MPASDFDSGGAGAGNFGAFNNPAPALATPSVIAVTGQAPKGGPDRLVKSVTAPFWSCAAPATAILPVLALATSGRRSGELVLMSRPSLMLRA